MADSGADEIHKQEMKVVLLGDISVGKTCVALRFVRDEFNDKTSATIGGVFISKTIKDGNLQTFFKVYNFQFLDG